MFEEQIAQAVVELTPQQIQCLASLRENGVKRYRLRQTYTESGGTHLYIELVPSTGLPDMYHLSRAGKLVELGLVHDG